MPALSPRDAIIANASRAEKRITFDQLRKQGFSIAAASRAAGIHPQTGYRWTYAKHPRTASPAQALASILSRDEVAAELSWHIKGCRGNPPEEPAQRAYVSALCSTLSEIQGYKAPTEVRIHDTAREKLADYLISRLEARLSGNVPRGTAEVESRECAQVAATTFESSPMSDNNDYVNLVQTTERAKVVSAEVTKGAEIPPGESGGGGV